MQVVTGSDWGGAQQHVLWLAQGLRERGFAVSVACQPGGYLVDRLKQARIAVWVLPHMARSISPYHDLRTYRDLRTMLTDGAYDLVHAHSSKAGALTRLAAASRGIPVIFTAHGLVYNNVAMAAWKRQVYASAERFLGRYTSHLVTVSQADANAARRHRLVSDDRLTVVPNGVPVPLQEDLPALRVEGRQRLGLNPQAVVVGVIARLHPDKDLATWLRAAALARQQMPVLRFVVIGDGPEGAALRHLAHDLGLGEAIVWAGEQPDAARLLPALDAFALSSVKEGLPLTLLEAMAAGVPVAATAVGGVPEAVEDGRTGLLVPPRDPEALAEAMLRLAASEPAGAGPRARMRALGMFSVDAMVDSTVSIYAQVLRRHPAARRGRR
ncbi:MAG: glycosyltransferase family 4 protein [Bacillota bacterium]